MSLESEAADYKVGHCLTSVKYFKQKEQGFAYFKHLISAVSNFEEKIYNECVV